MSPTTQEEEKIFLDQFMAAGFNRRSVVNEGQRAAAFYHSQFGVNFTPLQPERFLRNGGRIPGVATLKPVYLLPEARFRITVATRKDEVQFLNTPASFTGWVIEFEEDLPSRGRFKGIVPKGARSFFTTLAFQPCKGQNQEECRNILDERNPHGITVIRLATREFEQVNQPGNFLNFDLTIDSPTLGRGSLTGIGFLAVTDDEKQDFRLTFIFGKDTH